MTRRNMIFLVYLNRSGSTFLSNQLSRQPTLAVPPEGHRALRRLLGQLGDPVDLSRRIDRLIRDSSTDDKFAAWGLDATRLRLRLASAKDGVDALYSTCDAFADVHYPEATSVLLKGYYLQDLVMNYSYDRLARGRALKIIFLLRDPRAMFASQKKSLSTASGAPMQDNPVAAALRWREAARATASLCGNSETSILIRYEDLVTRNVETLERLLEFLALGGNSRPFGERVVGGLDMMIPQQQRGLHKYISHPPINSRVDAWREDLHCGERAAIEYLSSKHMKRFGYQPTRENAFRDALAGVPYLLKGAFRLAEQRINRRD